MKPDKAADQMSVKELAQYIDYSVLKPEFKEEDIIALCKDGVELGCATICINPVYIELCEPLVEGSDTLLCPVVDFPFGLSSTASRVDQILKAGQSKLIKEIDIVMNFGHLRSHQYDKVTEDLKACADAAHQCGYELKAILETDALSKEEIKEGIECIVNSGADWIKTSTGFLTGHELEGASVEMIEFIQECNQDRKKIKGSGCIRTREHFLKLIDMGIDRMGIGYRSVPVVLDLEKS